MMSWLWGSSSDKTSDPSKDPLRDLDPSLRDFLKKESPVKYEPTPSAPQEPAQPTAPAASARPETDEHGNLPPVKEPPMVFKDGRYKHLWATYQPQSAVEASTKSDAEKIADVLEGYKYRKAEIGRAALENCALEQMLVNECFSSGGLRQRLTMCKDENRGLERCVTMQQRFLKALGYLSNFQEGEEGKLRDEKIQMHADRLYHRMLDQEAEIAKAKEEGRPVPDFGPLIGKVKVTDTPAESAAAAAAASTSPIANAAAQAQSQQSAGQASPLLKLSDSVQKQIKEKLEGMNGIERELEEKALIAEVTMGQQVNKNLKNIFSKEEAERVKRREEGRETIIDRFTSMFGGK